MKLFASLIAFIAAVAAFPARAAAFDCDPARDGARPDDAKPDTRAIQSAIDRCKDRGGRVVLAAGRWLTGGLVLGSNMEFHLAPGARLEFIPDMALFPTRTTDRADADPEALTPGLFAPHVRNLIISGPGVIDGHGPAFWDEGFLESGASRPTRPRPMPAIEFAECADVVVDGLAMRDLPGYAIRFNGCRGVRATNVSIRNDPRSPNTDGIQIRDTSDVFIDGAHIETGDDAIVLKSRRRIIENVVVTRAVLKSDDAALKFGTGSAVGVRNALFSEIVIRDSRYGIAIFQMDGGRHADVVFSDILIETGGRHPRPYAIFADIDRRTPESPLGAIDRLTFRDIDIRTTGNILIAGAMDAPIRDLVLDGVRVSTPEGAPALASGPSKPRGNVTLSRGETGEDYARVEAVATLANIDGLSLRGVRADVSAGDAPRHVVWLRNVIELHEADVVGHGAGREIGSAVHADR